MKFTDNLIKTFGNDKLLHFLVAGWLTQIGTLFGWKISLIFILIIIIVSYLKEKLWDKVSDNQDLYAALTGCIFAFLIQWI